MVNIWPNRSCCRSFATSLVHAHSFDTFAQGFPTIRGYYSQFLYLICHLQSQVVGTLLQKQEARGGIVACICAGITIVF